MHNAVNAPLLALSLCLLALTQPSFAQPTGGALSATAVEEVLTQSLTQKKGLSIYIGGQVINAIFVKRIDGNTTEAQEPELRSHHHSHGSC